MRIGNLPVNNDILGVLLAIVSLVFSLGIGGMIMGGGGATPPTTAVEASPTTEPEEETLTAPEKEPTAPAPGAPRFFNAATPIAATEVTQGKDIFLPKDGNTSTSRRYTTCTLGFVYKPLKVGYTAGHCGRDHAPGTEVFMNVGTGGATKLEKIGTWEGASSNYQQNISFGYFQNINYDFGYIRLDDSATAPIAVNANPHSGDAVENYVPENGTEVCMFRSKTSPHVYCAPFHKNHTNYMLLDSSSVQGESGGPVWVKGGGFFGVISGYGSGADPRDFSKNASLVWIAPAFMSDAQYR